MELVQFAGVKPADAGGTVWLAGARAASVVGETATRSILSVRKLGQVLLRQQSGS